MGPLLQKIAWALYDRVIRVLHIPTLFGLVCQLVRLIVEFWAIYEYERKPNHSR